MSNLYNITHPFAPKTSAPKTTTAKAAAPVAPKAAATAYYDTSRIPNFDVLKVITPGQVAADKLMNEDVQDSDGARGETTGDGTTLDPGSRIVVESPPAPASEAKKLTGGQIAAIATALFLMFS